METPFLSMMNRHWNSWIVMGMGRGGVFLGGHCMDCEIWLRSRSMLSHDRSYGSGDEESHHRLACCGG